MLPKKTAIKKQIPKTLIYKKFSKELVGKRKTKFEENISRINIVNEISPHSTNLKETEDTSAIFVLQIEIKSKDFDYDTIEMMAKLFKQKIITMLHFEDEYQLALYNIKILKTAWQKEEPSLTIVGYNLDEAWNNFIAQIGNIKLSADKNIDEEINRQICIEKQKKKIEALKNKMNKEIQSRKKFELYKEIKKLERELAEMDLD